ncbi:MMPL/RND family transporter [Mycolicibacterium thermoresistibile]|uniref:Transporter n=2 Tax=Mycolicibacterium thermoresistibile TaxID=1797 RepID=G7CI66_MYCT3|nr:RND family transporter [Mycolicibacterium thermoresistibile]EHI11276.1 transporter [Mycolicibacterium thermoresistibile ATCC 19527]MCV7190401.1 RND family transporter [Mycolicibacterium thermoresistibile]GAT14237.1 membrane protein mmpL4 [Mycolicibacterium thermoresistibile]SNW20762.1 transmembrane protein [Mycolicibacterium thermoresistibile]
MGLEQSRADTGRPFIARTVRTFAPVVIIGWLVLILIGTFSAPLLERVGEENAVSLMPPDAPSAQAMAHIGRTFEESDSDSYAMIVLEGRDPLGAEARAYYAELVRTLRADTAHVANVQDLWGDRLTSSSVQSPDGRAAYVQLTLVGNQGTTMGDESVAAIREIVDRSDPPPGVDVYVTGAAPLVSDMQASGNRSVLTITIVTVIVIFTMLLLVYRSVITVVLLLTMVGFQLGAARALVAYLGDNGVLELSTFAVNMLVFLAIAAGTDYGIFYFGRYQEERQAGRDPEAAYYAMFRGVTPVVLASGLTIAGAILCLSFTRLPYFNTMGVPAALGMLAAVSVAVTVVPAGVAVATRFGLLEPKRKLRVRRWRGIGTAIVRWPVPIVAASLAVALVGLVTLPGYQTSYNDREYIPADIPANVGFAVADKHFSQARMTPELLMIEADRDLRNPTDFLVLNKVAKAIFAVRGVSRVQAITRPEGTPMESTSIPFLLSLQSAAQEQVTEFQADRIDDMLKQAEDMEKTIALMEHMHQVMREMADTTHSLVGKAHELQQIASDLRGSITIFDDFFRPIRNYFYWEPHCYNIPICWALRSLFDAMDGVDTINDQLEILVEYMDRMDALLPQMLAQMPAMIASMKTMRAMTLTMHSTMSGLIAQMNESGGEASAMGRAFDAAQNDDTFYLPPEVFDNPDFQRAMGFFLSPDGHAVRYIISHSGPPATTEGIERTERILTAAEEALKGTPLGHARIYLAGAASTAKDWQEGSKYDLWIAGVAAICLVFVIMLVFTRSPIAALVIVGTVVLSLGASFGMSVLVWQYIFGINLHWMVLAMSLIILLAVGSDYNLMLVSRMKEEMGAGLNTGLIRAMGGTGKVVTVAGLVFAATMASMVVSDLRIIGQVGTTIGLGLLFDTMVVRAFLTPSIAAVLGRWFWWPQRVRPRPASGLLRSDGPRPVVRRFMLPPEPPVTDRA